jgi:primosomal protein N' (replication factor Y)
VYNLRHPVLGFVKQHDVGGFYRYEIQYRADFNYPPFSRLFKVVVRHKNEQKAAAAAQVMADQLRTIPAITVQGPEPALIARVKDQYHYEIWIKCPKVAAKVQELKTALLQQKQQLTAIKGNSQLVVVVDVDPY